MTRRGRAAVQTVVDKTAGCDADRPAGRPSDAGWKGGAGGPRHKVVWDDPRGSSVYSNNCGQRVMMPDGDVMMSFTFLSAPTMHTARTVSVSFAVGWVRS